MKKVYKDNLKKNTVLTLVQRGAVDLELRAVQNRLGIHKMSDYDTEIEIKRYKELLYILKYH